MFRPEVTAPLLGKPSPLQNVQIGYRTYGVGRSTCVNPTTSAPIKIGKYCSIAAGVLLLAHEEHPTTYPSTYPFRTQIFSHHQNSSHGEGDNRDAITRGGITIGHDVWIGRNVIVLSGVTIGTGAVIGAGAVVPRDVPPYAVVVGNPARITRFRFTPEIIDELLQSSWWDLPDHVLSKLEPFLYSTDIAAFIKAVKRERESSA